MNYSEQLKSPMWQKRRLEIMSKDKFTCQICGDNTTQLNVHHLYYETGKLIHDYPDKALITLCENCHKNEHDMQEQKMKDVLSFFSKRGMTMFEFYAIIELIDVYVYGLKHINFITNTFGDSSGQYDDDLKRLEKRRNSL